MNWLNIRTSTLRTPEFISSEPVERATWLCVLSYAAEQENAGILRGAALWSDRQWQQTCGVTLQEVRSAVKLLRIVGDDVFVAFYPLDQQHECERKKQGGRAGAAKTNALRASKRSTGKLPGHSHHAPSTPVGSPVDSAHTEENRIEREGNGTPPTTVPSAMEFPPDVHPEIPPVEPTASAPASLPEVSADAGEQIGASRAPAAAGAASTHAAHPAEPDASSQPPHRISSPRKDADAPDPPESSTGEPGRAGVPPAISARRFDIAGITSSWSKIPMPIPANKPSRRSRGNSKTSPSIAEPSSLPPPR